MRLIPKKSLGQHFLRSESALQKIAAAADLSKNDVVLEVGPGEGILTEKILKSAEIVIAVEKDSRSIEILKERFKKEIEGKKLALIEKDILEVNLQKEIREEYKVVANIPYYISGALFRFFLETKHQPTSMTLLVQKEVAERIIARDKKESILSMSVKAYGKVSMKGIVKAGSFFPPPKVDSAILHIEDISKVFFSENKITEKKFFEVLRAGFAHKRKIVSGNLKEKDFKLPNDMNQKSRAEDLILHDWARISKEN